MKKIIKIFAVILVVSILSYAFIFGFSNNNNSSKKSASIPVETVVDSFFTELKKGDIKSALKYVESASNCYSIDAKIKNKTYEDLLKMVLSKIQYKIDDINLKDSFATVKLQIESVDLLSFYNKYFEELSPLIKGYLSGNEKEKVQAKNQIKTLLVSRVDNDIQKGNYEKFKGTVKINLVMRNGEWIIEADDNLIYYLSGKMTALMAK